MRGVESERLGLESLPRYLYEVCDALEIEGPASFALVEEGDGELEHDDLLVDEQAELKELEIGVACFEAESDVYEVIRQSLPIQHFVWFFAFIPAYFGQHAKLVAILRLDLLRVPNADLIQPYVVQSQDILARQLD